MAQDATLHLVKLAVGAESVASLAAWQKSRAPILERERGDPRPRHTTRMQPKRAAELLAGGSLFWVIKGVVRCRQRLVAIDPVEGDDGIMRHDLVLDPTIMAVRARPMRPFQGWRYLMAPDAPPDAPQRAVFDADTPVLPAPLERALMDVGVV